MNHYICTGSCHGESKTPGICEADFCTKEGQSLIECSCEDGSHENPGGENTENNPDLN